MVVTVKLRLLDEIGMYITPLLPPYHILITPLLHPYYTLITPLVYLYYTLIVPLLLFDEIGMFDLYHSETHIYK
jgi:hypothetical protein